MTEPSARTGDPVQHPLPSELLHDLRTPLNHVIGYSELLLEQVEEAGQSELLPYLGKVRAAGHHLLALINDNFVSIKPPGAPEAPLAPAPRAGVLPARRAGDVSSASAWGSVLVVDDDEANRDLLCQRLERQGYEVVTATNGRGALDLLAASTFDLVLLDVVMPEMDGFEMLRRLKGDGRLRHIPVIMISGVGDMDSVAHCIEIGAEDYLPKPFQPTLLQARITASLEKKRARDREILMFEQLQENHRRLQELEALRDEVVHDLRAPLTALIAEMHLLEGVTGLSEAQREVVASTVAGGERALGVIEGFRDVGEPEPGSAPGRG